MENIYEQKSVNKLIFIFGIPAILSLMIETLTGIVDTAFAGNLPQIGGEALAAMSLLSPLMTVFIALQTLFAMSTGIMIARYFNNSTKLHSNYLTGILMSLLVATISSGICFVAMNKLLTALGATGLVLELAGQYLRIELISNIVSSLGYTLTCCIRAFGFPKVETVIITSAVFINIISNFLLAFVFHLGIAGLAWGTLISEVACAIIALCWLTHAGLGIKLQKIPLKELLQNTFAMLKVGIAQTAIQLLGGVTGFFINGRLLAWGTLNHLAAWTIVQRLYTLMIMPIVGITQGMQTIIAYFNGCRNQAKSQQTTKLTMGYATLYGIATLVLIYFAGPQLLHLFGGSPQVFAIAQNILPLIFIGFPFVGILYTDMTVLQVTDHEVAAVMLAVTRQVFLVVPLMLLLPLLGEAIAPQLPPLMWIFFSVPIADLLAAFIAAGIKRRLKTAN